MKNLIREPRNEYQQVVIMTPQLTEFMISTKNNGKIIINSSCNISFIKQVQSNYG